jgi:hypothetical protein
MPETPAFDVTLLNTQENKPLHELFRHQSSNCYQLNTLKHLVTLEKITTVFLNHVIALQNPTLHVLVAEGVTP